MCNININIININEIILLLVMCNIINDNENVCVY